MTRWIIWKLKTTTSIASRLEYPWLSDSECMKLAKTCSSLSLHWLTHSIGASQRQQPLAETLTAPTLQIRIKFSSARRLSHKDKRWRASSWITLWKMEAAEAKTFNTIKTKKPITTKVVALSLRKHWLRTRSWSKKVSRSRVRLSRCSFHYRAMVWPQVWNSSSQRIYGMKWRKISQSTCS